ncbi:unnamed protein product [Rhizoctonia solani]|uniref:Uncharacterized protein n=1 Tax=Rhizoctonia solani TaxID=456999 RepID=A0A8H3BS05_9AGAM|nr:unnamed protein product [Rhizoctonia solani]
MPSLQNGIYRIKSRVSQSQDGGQLFVGIDNKQGREHRDGNIKEGTPIVLVRKEKITKVEVQNIGGDNYRMMFVSQEASGMNLGCDKDNLQKNNKMFVTKEEVEWAIDQGSQKNCFHVQVRESGMYMTVPQNAKENTQIKLEQLKGEEGQEWEFERIERGD